MSTRRSFAVALVLASCMLGACRDRPSRDDSSNHDSSRHDDVAFQTRDSALTLGANDMRIVSTDGKLEMALVGPNVVMRMSDAAMTNLRRELDTTQAAAQGGMGGWFEKKVKGAVQELVNKQIVLPVASIEDVRYENGEIRIILHGSRKPVGFPGLGSGTKREGRVSARATFAPDDAERFVAAVRAAKERHS